MTSHCGLDPLFGSTTRGRCTTRALARPLAARSSKSGVAYSDDRFSWRADPLNPISTIDPTRYETYPGNGWHNQIWRDPWVVPHWDGSLTMLVTARARDDAIPLDERGAWRLPNRIADASG